MSVTNLESLNRYLSEQDNSRNSLLFSDIPQKCKDFPCVLGIDEAGRGPVLGPMVYGTAFCPINEMAQLLELDCQDSKVLTEQVRDKMFENICNSSNIVGWGVEVISPNTICNNMLRRTKHSLNEVSMDSAINLIRTARDAGVNINHVYVDTVGPPEKYQDYLKKLFPSYEITDEKKADSKYSIVSAASICAKVVRDHALSTWDFQEGLNVTVENFGSGYPGDPVTKKFLADNCDPVFGYPTLVRFSWSTAQTALEDAAYHVEWENEQDEPKTPQDNTAITSFFKSKPKSIVKSKHDFFTKRCLKNITEF